MERKTAYNIGLAKAEQKCCIELLNMNRAFVIIWADVFQIPHCTKPYLLGTILTDKVTSFFKNNIDITETVFLAVIDLFDTVLKW